MAERGISQLVSVDLEAAVKIRDSPPSRAVPKHRPISAPASVPPAMLAGAPDMFCPQSGIASARHLRQSAEHRRFGFDRVETARPVRGQRIITAP
jgi:hypothetical protein